MRIQDTTIEISLLEVKTQQNRMPRTVYFAPILHEFKIMLILNLKPETLTLNVEASADYHITDTLNPNPKPSPSTPFSLKTNLPAGATPGLLSKE